MPVLCAKCKESFVRRDDHGCAGCGKENINKNGFLCADCQTWEKALWLAICIIEDYIGITRR